MEFTDSGDIVRLCLEERFIAGRVLLIHADTGVLASALRARGLEVVEWGWMWSARPLMTWPPEGLFDVVILHLPTIRELSRVAIEVAASRLAPGGELLTYGANHEGIKTIKDHFAPWFEEPEVLLYKHRHRVVSAVRSTTEAVPRTRLEDWQHVLKADIAGVEKTFLSYPGMFAHGSVDQGTQLLLKHLPTPAAEARVLDMGSGTGILAHALLAAAPTISLDAVDLNAFAVEATKTNVPNAHVFWGDSWNALPQDAKYHLIVSNPPVHQGAIQTTQPLDYFISHAKEHLLPGGMITLVVQGTIPVKRFFNRAGFIATLVAEDPTYQVWQAH